MLRPRCAVLVAVLVGVSGATLAALSPATLPSQRAYLREQKNRVEIPAHYEPLTFADFLALPSLGARYTVADWDIVRAHSQRAVSVEGYLAEVIRAQDGATYGRPPEQGDLHLHLRPTPQPRCFPDGPRGMQLVTEVTPHFQPPKTGWSYEALLDLCQRQAHVRISGWLLHDYPHVRDVGDWRASAWEVHPITKIEVEDAEGHVWRPLP